MNQTTPLRSAAASSTGLGPKPGPQALDGGASASFKALLDDLEQRAQSLEIESGKQLSQDELAGVVDDARISLDQLLSLKDQLLEAWQASQMQTPARGRGKA